AARGAGHRERGGRRLSRRRGRRPGSRRGRRPQPLSGQGGRPQPHRVGADMRAAAVIVLAALGVPARAATGEIPSALVVLEVFGRVRPDDVAESAPARFVLLEDGQVFVGGTSRLEAGRLSSAEVKALDRRVADVRKLPGLAGTVRLGGGEGRQRLLLRRGRPLDMAVVGDASQAAPALRLLAALIDDLTRFDHPSLRPYEPATYAVSAREATLAGGCRSG